MLQFNNVSFVYLLFVLSLMILFIYHYCSFLWFHYFILSPLFSQHITKVFTLCLSLLNQTHWHQMLVVIGFTFWYCIICLTLILLVLTYIFCLFSFFLFTGSRKYRCELHTPAVSSRKHKYREFREWAERGKQKEHHLFQP